MDMLKLISKATQGMRDRIMLMMGRAVLQAVNDAGGIQIGQASILEDEERSNLERLQDYGFTSVPLSGADAFVAFPGGNRDNGVILRVDDRRYRLASLKGGEVAIYTDEGDFIILKRDNNIEVKTLHLVINAQDDATINTKKFELNASESIVMTTPQTGIHTDNLDMQGKDGNGGDMDATLRGRLTATDDVRANNGAVSLRHHVNECGNCGTTGKPVGG